MVSENKHLLAFNRGVISRIGLARIDLERMAMSAEIQSNWIPRVLGSMMLRPGLEFIGNSLSDDFARQISFTFGVDDNAQLELTDSNMRVRIDDILITRPTVTATIANPNFGADIASWTDNDEAGGASIWVNDTLFGGVMSLIGDGENAAIRTQEVTVTETGTEHAIDIEVVRGSAKLRVGSTDGDDDYVTETFLGRGVHQLSFTPTGNFWIEVSNTEEHSVFITSIDMSGTGALNLATPWGNSLEMRKLRFEQSGDVIYVALDGVRQSKIERRGDGRSWSVVNYFTADGPFRVQNTGPIELNVGAISGQTTLFATRGGVATSFFKPSIDDDANPIFRLQSAGQTVTDSASAANVFTDPIRVAGEGEARRFSIIIEGTWSATVTVQFSIGTDAGPWTDLTPQYTANVNTSYLDQQDGQIIYYRIGVKTGDYTSGTVTFTLVYASGSISGICRINQYVSATQCLVSVLKDFGSIDATKDWWEGEWSGTRGFPSSVAIHEGRLSWAGLDKIWLSVSDAYESFDDDVEGDSGTISRSIGFGPQRVIHWLVSMGRLLMGTSENSHNIEPVKMDGNQPLGARSNSFDEPLTPFNFNIKTTSSRGVFVDRTEQRLYEMAYDLDQQDYKSLDLSVFAPDFNAAGIVQIAVQMKPDIRIHCVRSDGTVGVLIYDRLENVICWVDVLTDGLSGIVEDVSVLPGVVEDQVYYFVRRSVGGGFERHLCKWALESEAIGGQLNKMADSFVSYTGGATLTPFTTELLHLRDETVIVWADGADVGTAVVSAAGGLTLADAASNVVAGLGYTAQFKSTKLGDIQGIGLLERKKIARLGFVAENIHWQGLQYGPNFTDLSDMPQVEGGAITAADTVHSEYHEDDFAFGGDWDTDSRICLQAAAPRPCTILAAIAEMESVERGRQVRRS